MNNRREDSIQQQTAETASYFPKIISQANYKRYENVQRYEQKKGDGKLDYNTWLLLNMYVCMKY